MRKHTPGPWEFEHVDDDEYRINHRHDNDGEVGLVGTLAETYDEANARLIAAAPDMYEALKRIEDIIDVIECLSFSKTEPGSIADQFRAAIAKAEGSD